MGAAPVRAGTSPWYLRGKTVILGAGALAGASLAVLGLWDRVLPADQVDIATISSVNVLKKISLGDFTTANSAENPALGPMRPAAFAISPAPTTLATVAPPPTGGVIAPTVQPSPSPANTPQPTFTTESPSPRPTVVTPSLSPSIRSTASDPQKRVTPLPTSTQRPPGWSPFDDLLDEALANPAVDGWELTRRGAEWVPGRLVKAAEATRNVDPNDPASGELSAEEVAERLAESLSHIEARNDGGRLDPLGWAARSTSALKATRTSPCC